MGTLVNFHPDGMRRLKTLSKKLGHRGVDETIAVALRLLWNVQKVSQRQKLNLLILADSGEPTNRKTFLLPSVLDADSLKHFPTREAPNA